MELRKKKRYDLVDVAIPEEKSFLFKATVLGDSVKEIQSNIELQIQDNVPFKLSEVVFDFSFLGTRNKKGESTVMVSALPLAVVHQYIEAFQSAGFLPVSFQVESQAVARAVVSRTNKDNLLVVNAKQDRVGFYIVSNQTVRFSSTSDIAPVADFNQVDTQKEPGDIDENYMSVLAREIKKILTYWSTHDGEEEDAVIHKIIVVCDTKKEAELISYIARHIELPVEMANVWQNAFSFDDAIPEMERSDSLRYAAAIGLALP